MVQVRTEQTSFRAGPQPSGRMLSGDAGRKNSKPRDVCEVYLKRM